MLSRHLYELDEVKSALQYCCIEQKTLEACFWLQELIDSDEIEIAISGLVEVYLFKYGTSRLEWLLQMYKMCNEPVYDVNILNSLTCALCQLNKKDMDVSLISLYLACTHDSKNHYPPEKLLGLGPDWLETAICGFNPIEKFFARSLSNRKYRSAMWSFGLCNPDYISSIIKLFIPYLHPSLQQSINAIMRLTEWSQLHYPLHILQVFCMMVIGVQPLEMSNIFAPLQGPSHFIINNIQLWESETGRVVRRHYKIPNECLYGVTRRGIIVRDTTTEIELMKMGSSPENTFRVIYDCSCWMNLWNNCNGCKTDEDWELFCENAFPDDIPDEWPLEERSKSHGPGLINPGEKLYWRRWLHKWITPVSYGAENKKYINNDNYLVTTAIDELVLIVPLEKLNFDIFLLRLINIIHNNITKIHIDEDYLQPQKMEDIRAASSLAASLDSFRF
jgi:hypothetical protein